jgi:hypothetical protein
LLTFISIDESGAKVIHPQAFKRVHREKSPRTMNLFGDAGFSTLHMGEVWRVEEAKLSI